MRETKTNRHKRRHRHDCEVSSKEVNCCRYPLTIDFDEFGFDWEFVLQPRRFQAWYCAGDCPLSYYSSSPHSHLVSLQRDEHLPGGPCCTPAVMSPISMIYFTGDGSIVSKVLPKMVVEACGCN